MLTSNPKPIFLFDSAGGFLSALFLFIIGLFHTRFGLAQTTAFALAGIAAAYCIYSLCCYYFVAGRWKAYLLAVTVANVLYSIFTIWLVFYNYQQLTALGVTYFVLELIVLYVLIGVEVKSLLNKN